MSGNDIQQLIAALNAAVGSRVAQQGYVDIGDAKIDLDRERRRGTPEVIFCEGKTPSQIAAIASTLVQTAGLAYGTRCSESVAAEVDAIMPGAQYDVVSRTIRFGPPRPAFTADRTGVIAAGTSDRPVAEEACVTLETFGAPVDRIYDVGVAGLHRLLDQRERIDRTEVIIVVAGMEGALPSVIGGLCRQPIIAVPTSVGYGTALGGFTALFGMLTSCSSGVSVVNIDNGFGAAMSALAILRSRERARSTSGEASA